MDKKQNTIYLNLQDLQKKEREEKINNLMKEVYAALKEKGYNPISQLTGYLLSDDPTYITAHNGARFLITKVERDEIIEVMLEKYLNDL